jgi:hypothetical protein
MRFRWFLHLVKRQQRWRHRRDVLKALFVAFLGIFKRIEPVGKNSTEVTKRGKVHLNVSLRTARLLSWIFDVRRAGADGHPVIYLRQRHNRG